METIGDFVAPFAHRPLPDYHIRVVHILPSDQPDAPIECRIAVHSNQLERAKYEALSYAWGDPQDGEKTILVDGQPFAVRLNLWLFLKQLRKDRSVRVVWADAICIDQSNTEERNHQVKFMGDIYRHADRTLIWLGPSDQDSDMLFEAISMIYKTTSPHREYYEKVKSLSDFDLRTSIPEFQELWELIEEHKRKSLLLRDKRVQLGSWYRKALSNHFSDSTTFMKLQYHVFGWSYKSNATTYDLFVARNELAMPTSADSVEVLSHSKERGDEVSERMGNKYAGLLVKSLTLSDFEDDLRFVVEQEALTRQDLLKNHPLMLKALSDLSARPYWKRLWIIQEIILSRHIELFCGSMTVSWDAMVIWLQSCNWSRHDNGQIVTVSNTMTLYLEWSRRYEEMVIPADDVESHGLDAVVETFESFLCTDIRDKIYGLLGLVETPLEPDYSKTPLELFSQLMDLFAKGLRQPNSTEHQRSVPAILYFARVLQRTLCLDTDGSEDGAKDDMYSSIIQGPVTIFGEILATVSNIVGVKDIADALFENWVIHRAATDHQKISARSKLLQCVSNLEKFFERRSHESFGVVQCPLFSVIAIQSDQMLAVRYSPNGNEGKPIKRKNPSASTEALCWFVYSPGHVGVSDVNVQGGDLVCNFSGISPTHALILRKSHSGFRIAGRAIISPTPFTNAGSFEIKGQHDQGALKDSRSEISFDAISLLAFVLLPFP